jgi:DNA-directed RNA polymerase subunit L
MRDLRVVKKTDRELLLEIWGEDHTLGNMLAKEALRHPDVTYAAYRIPHPLQDKLELYITVKEGSDPGRVLKEVCDKLKEYLDQFYREVEEKISEA